MRLFLVLVFIVGAALSATFPDARGFAFGIALPLVVVVGVALVVCDSHRKRGETVPALSVRRHEHSTLCAVNATGHGACTCKPAQPHA